MLADSRTDVGINESSSELFNDEFVCSATVSGGTMVSEGKEGKSTVLVAEVKYWSISNFDFLAEGCIILRPVFQVAVLLRGLSRL